MGRLTTVPIAHGRTRTAGYLTFFRMQRGTVKYLRTPASVKHMGHWVSGAARVARVRKGDPGFDALCNTYEGHVRSL